MTRADIQHEMRAVENRAASLGVALYDLIERMTTYSDRKGENWKHSPKGKAFMGNLDRLEGWHATACEVDTDSLELEE